MVKDYLFIRKRKKYFWEKSIFLNKKNIKYLISFRGGNDIELVIRYDEERRRKMRGKR